MSKFNSATVCLCHLARRPLHLQADAALCGTPTHSRSPPHRQQANVVAGVEVRHATSGLPVLAVWCSAPGNKCTRWRGRHAPLDPTPYLPRLTCARFHFSFADYHNPANTNFGCLRVLNDDLVKPRAGFGTHSHRDAEIFSYVVRGQLAHKVRCRACPCRAMDEGWVVLMVGGGLLGSQRLQHLCPRTSRPQADTTRHLPCPCTTQDSMGNYESLPRGCVQYLSAGSGISHSEMNDGDTICRFLQVRRRHCCRCCLCTAVPGECACTDWHENKQQCPLSCPLQIWLTPDQRGHEPQYGSTTYTAEDRHNRLLHILGGTGAAPAWPGVHRAGECIRLHQVRLEPEPVCV